VTEEINREPLKKSLSGQAIEDWHPEVVKHLVVTKEALETKPSTGILEKCRSMKN